MLKPDQWPLKVAFGIAALLIGAGDLSFGSQGVSPGVLLLLGLLLVAEGYGDRGRSEANKSTAAPPAKEASSSISIKPRLMKLEEQAKTALADRNKTPSQHRAARKVLDGISGSTAMGNRKSQALNVTTPSSQRAQALIGRTEQLLSSGKLPPEGVAQIQRAQAMAQHLKELRNPESGEPTPWTPAAREDNGQT